MGFFGGAHTDGRDLPGLLSAMVVASSLPPGKEYEAGRFHLLALGMFVDLGKISVIYFSGRLQHGGTAPLAPVGDTVLDTSAIRAVGICYPSGPLLSSKTAMCASGLGSQAYALPYETLMSEYVLHISSCLQIC